jgi:glycosyltransferase involved in cell wall biosynthesis
MQILFLNEYASPHIVSGAERSMMALSSALNKKIKVYTLSPNLGPARSVLAGLKLKFPFPFKVKPGQTLTPFWFNNPIFWFFTAYHIVKTIKTHNINLIHVHGKYIQPAAIIASWFTKVAIITTVRDFKFLCPLALCYTHQQRVCSWSYYHNHEIPFYLKNYASHNPIKPLIYLQLIFAKLWQSALKFFLNQSKSVIAVSPQLKNIYQQAGVKNTESIYNLPPKKQKIVNKIKLSKTILSVGKLSYGKGTDTIIKTAFKLPEYQFILAGPKNISVNIKLPKNVKYLGQLDHSKVMALYKKADVFIINSRWPEPLSRAGLEALSFGLPIIASDRGGNQELIKDNGLLVNPDNPTEIIKAIKNIYQKDLRKLSKNSHILFSARFSKEKIISKHINLYNKSA